ncbi:glycoside hydrolase family 27 protein [Saccharothrix coeruleofusca]|uniref:Alpha-galactosidase n=1 Tax=Saccharothrix coeruleofusca TaxID=33919 RepID=A0A918AP47_9PSEU|nr:glycoside hydrolase family 27 protein [Saccharothrix coeruleofusca]GGP65150.1 alpha-galactosidase [Saccharothrix coeruleofusca]
MIRLLPSARRGRFAALLAAAALVVAGAAAVTTTAAAPAQALENGVARTPPMGWNTWNTFGCDINEQLIRQTADALVANGMAARGYRYVVVDDCWFDPDRDAQGNLRAHPTRFPSGMKALGDYLHGKGLKFGLYQVPAAETCAQYFNAFPGATGSKGHEVQDARQFAAWGVDFLKYDWCSPQGTIDDQVRDFAKMRDALAATGRPIVYSINPNSIHAKTGRLRDWGDVANMWRTTEDITNRWDTGSDGNSFMGVKNIIDWTVPLASYAQPGGFNDPDMMEVGNGGMTDTEQRSHFAMWAIMAAPLIAGNDVRNASSATLSILNNSDLITVNQDPLGLQGVQVSFDGTRRVLAKRLADGDVAVAMLNQGNTTTTISTTANTIGKTGSSFTLRDLWTGATSTTTGAISASVPAHGTAVFRVSGGGDIPLPTAFALRSASAGRCVDAPESSTADGTQPVIWDCHGAANQRFMHTGNTLQLLGKCLETPTNATAGTRVQLWACNGGTHQQWTLNGNGTISNARNGLCLDVDNNGTANNTPVIVWTCHDGANQRWTRV